MTASSICGTVAVGMASMDGGRSFKFPYTPLEEWANKVGICVIYTGNVAMI